MKRYSVREKGRNIGRKIVMIIVILSLSFSVVSWENFSSIFAAVATYGRTDDEKWLYKVLDAGSKTVSIRPLDLGELSYSKIEIPSSVEIQGASYIVTEISDCAFYQCLCSDCLRKNKMSLSTAWEDENGNYEGEAVNISISEAVVPDTVTTIGYSAFELCTLEKITFEKTSNLEIIGENAFSECTLETIEIPASVTEIGSEAFYYSWIRTITFEEGSKLKEISDYTFEESGLESIILPESITKIGEGAFLGCDLTEITIPSSVTSIEFYAFEANPELKKVDFAENGSLQRIRIGAFMECDLREVIIPSSVTTIGVCAFGNNYNLDTVTFKTSTNVDNLKKYAFGEISGYDYESDYVEDMDYEKNSSVTQVNVENYDVYQWIADKGIFKNSAKINSVKTRVFLNELKAENVQDDVDMKEDNQVTLHIDDYVTAKQGYHFEGSQLHYSDTLNLEKISTGEIEKTEFVSHGYPYVVIKPKEEANKYEINYDVSGGETAIDNTECQYGEPITISSTTPVRMGYEFLGWSQDPTGEGTVYQPGEIIYENLSDKDGGVVTLYAVWKEITKKVTIHFSTPEKKAAAYGYEITVMRNGATIQQHDVSSSDVGEKQIVISGAKIGEVYTIKCANYEKENGQKKYFQTTTKEVTIE